MMLSPVSCGCGYPPQAFELARLLGAVKVGRYFGTEIWRRERDLVVGEQFAHPSNPLIHSFFAQDILIGATRENEGARR